jgi:hypothetical protein
MWRYENNSASILIAKLRIHPFLRIAKLLIQAINIFSTNYLMFSILNMFQAAGGLGKEYHTFYSLSGRTRPHCNDENFSNVFPLLSF